MSDQRLLKNKDKIKKIIELACKFKLNAKLVFGEIEQDTYFLNVSESGRLAVVHRQNEVIDGALTSGESVTLRFDYVERGYLHIFAFEIVAPENSSYKYYDTIWVKMPESLQETCGILANGTILRAHRSNPCRAISGLAMWSITNRTSGSAAAQATAASM